MTWKKKRRVYGKNKHYSVIKKLEKERKIDKAFQLKLEALSLEEVIALKLELAVKAAGNYMFGYQIWRSLGNIAKDATLKWALSVTRTKLEAVRLLGLDKADFVRLLREYGSETFFTDEKEA
tara:strand:+ start:1149 stop:1514 length:366 start_codon:yes stop_codon:yes gene_type:complete